MPSEDAERRRLLPNDPLDSLARLVEEGDALVRTARWAQQVPALPGSDGTESVTVSLNEQGLVDRVTIRAGWQQRLGPEGLPDAVVQAVRDASTRRLTAWGEAYGEGAGDEARHSAVSGSAFGRSTGDGVARSVELNRDDFQRRLRAAASRQMSSEDQQAALGELLEMVEAIERGIDEVSSKLHTTLSASYLGQSADRHVTVTTTGGGDVTAVRCDRTWLREAHEINIGRQITAAFREAYKKVAAQGVHKLIADSPLGEMQRATQDPFGLAHRLGMTD
jgi:DNA-binding protein YbaB